MQNQRSNKRAMIGAATAALIALGFLITLGREELIELCRAALGQ